MSSIFEDKVPPTLQQEIKEKWLKILAFVEENFQKKPDLNAILFLIGIRELGVLPDKNFTKEEKVHLMHIANCKVLSYSGYYTQLGFNKKGWPVWENTKPLPNLAYLEQENLLRQHIIEYFESEEILNF
jgi:hypothetical protein